jgi:hypothetical protein
MVWQLKLLINYTYILSHISNETNEVRRVNISDYVPNKFKQFYISYVKVLYMFRIRNYGKAQWHQCKASNGGNT